MSNTLRIKRRASSGSTGAPSSLANAELAFNEADDTLYYGKGTGGAGGWLLCMRYRVRTRGCRARSQCTSHDPDHRHRFWERSRRPGAGISRHARHDAASAFV